MNFPHNGKSLAEFSTQWKNIAIAVERRAVARTHNPVVTVAPLGARKVDDVVQILNK